jgi:hypothetical protein
MSPLEEGREKCQGKEKKGSNSWEITQMKGEIKEGTDTCEKNRKCTTKTRILGLHGNHKPY